MFGVGAVAQHLGVVVGLDHQGVGVAHVKIGALGDMACVCGDHHPQTVVVKCETDVVSAVM